MPPHPPEKARPSGQTPENGQRGTPRLKDTAPTESEVPDPASPEAAENAVFLPVPPVGVPKHALTQVVLQASFGDLFLTPVGAIVANPRQLTATVPLVDGQGQPFSDFDLR